ncbi:hypothetical protein HYH02_002356 [Chlamydomonas schloesseri]|uniref:Uncharacterized protein n=1 Tax=Chlamydomonas schloesseri TaxID=2026947 RepID=A0A836BAW2_9CHLO|nr:hypothetical protein HYH02_002356 [Chlamydomonas schloesseri]|eukprot:KAG2453021.1 hypothetical protein HYH02_002356 [Chlamydomonas schloesseri]
MWGSAASARGLAAAPAAAAEARGPVSSAPPAGPAAASFNNGSSYVPFPDIEATQMAAGDRASSAGPAASAADTGSGIGGGGGGGGLAESPAWSHYLRGTQGVLALVVLVLTASQPEAGGTRWLAMPPFRYLLAVAVMTLAAVLGCGVMQCLRAARRMSLPVNTAFDFVWSLLCATAGISAASALGLRDPLRLGCAAVSGEPTDCAQLKAATGLMFGVALLCVLSLAYEAALWRVVAEQAAAAAASSTAASSAPLPYGSTGTRYNAGGGRDPGGGRRQRLNVLYALGVAGLLGPNGRLRRAVEYIRYPEPLVAPEDAPGATAASVPPAPAVGEDWSDVDLAADTSRKAARGQNSRAAGAAAALKAAFERARGRGSSSSTSAVAAAALESGQGPLPVSKSAGAVLSRASVEPQRPSGSPAGAAAPAASANAMRRSGRAGPLDAAASLTSRYRVKEAPWLARWMLGLRLLQVALTAACLGAMTGGGQAHLPGGGYSSTTAYRLLVAAATLGLVAAVVLGVWQALRALSFGFYRFARRGTRAYMYSCAALDAVLWLLLASAATAAAAVSTLPCTVVVVAAPASGGPRMVVFSRVHAGCVARDRAAAAMGLLAAPVWLAAALLSALVAHEAGAKRALLRRQRVFKREAEVLMTTTTGYTGGGGGGGAGAEHTEAEGEGAAGWPAGAHDMAEAEETYAGMAASTHSAGSRGWWGTGVATGRSGPLSRGPWGSAASVTPPPGGSAPPPLQQQQATARRGSGFSSGSGGSRAADLDNGNPFATSATPRGADANPFAADPWVVEDSLPGGGAQFAARRGGAGRGWAAAAAAEAPQLGGGGGVRPGSSSSGGVEPVLDVRQERGDIHVAGQRAGGVPMFTLE